MAGAAPPSFPLVLAPRVGVFCHFEDSQWFAPEPVSTPIYKAYPVGHTLLLYEVSKSIPQLNVTLGEP